MTDCSARKRPSRSIGNQRFLRSTFLLALAMIAVGACARRDGYKARGGKIFYENRALAAETWDPPEDGWVVDGADPATFHELKGFGQWYGADNRSVFWMGVRIKGADPRTFVPLSVVFAKDGAAAFADGCRIEGADPSTFAAVDLVYARDARRAYAAMDGVPCEYVIEVIPAADMASFQVLNGLYSKDRTAVYFAVDSRPTSGPPLVAKVLAGADPATFEAVDHEYGVDRARVYFVGKPVDGLAPSEFLKQRRGQATKKPAK